MGAFVERNVHSSLNPMLPAVLIDTYHAKVALNCVVQDVLMISETSIGKVDLLWIMLYYGITGMKIKC